VKWFTELTHRNTETTLLLAFEGDNGLPSIRSLLEAGAQEVFRVAEAILPVTTENAYGRILTDIVAQHSPMLVVLSVPQRCYQCAQSLVPAIAKTRLPVMALLENASVDEASALLGLGATDFAMIPLRACDFLPRVRRLRSVVSRPDPEIAQLKEELGLKQFIGESPALGAPLQLIPKLARHAACVFITGETGTGKEMFARAIHYLSARAGRPFVPVNCGAIPAELVENELFGHERGAFTGATAVTHGLLHDADGGTLFLDEVDSLPPQTQVKLLRLLQDGGYRALGSRKICQANLRVIAASNADIEEAVRAGRFRSDLFYRLNVFPLRLPPLRERKGDIPILARHFVDKYAREFSVPTVEISQAALQKLLYHDWPGNVRELENVIQRALVLSERSTIGCAEIQLPKAPEISSPASFKMLKARAVVEFERTYLKRLLVENQGNISHAARAANKDRRAFWELLRKHNLHSTRPNTNHASHSGNVTLCQDKNIHAETWPSRACNFISAEQMPG